jgi:hypothetical protein
MVASVISLYLILPSQVCPGRNYLILSVVLRQHRVIFTGLYHVKESYIFWGEGMAQVLVKNIAVRIARCELFWLRVILKPATHDCLLLPV